MAGNLDTNTYYLSKNIKIFPSSNAVDEGKIFTEYNGRRLTIDITDLNYVVSPNPEGYAISFDSSTNKIQVQPGIAIINGFEVDTNSILSYRLPTENEVLSSGEYSGYALLCLHTLFDSLENLSGNIQVGSDWFCEGIRIEYTSLTDYEASPEAYLVLGGVKPDGTIKPNKDRFQRIDAKHILVRVEADPETGVPPTQKTDLLTFINNFLKGYWVSKGGDNVYGSLLFKNEPTNYLEEGFDYNLEEMLNSDKYGVKIDRDPDTLESSLDKPGRIIVKSYDENTESYHTVVTYRGIEFFRGKLNNQPSNAPSQTKLAFTDDTNGNDFSITSLKGKTQKYGIKDETGKFTSLNIENNKTVFACLYNDTTSWTSSGYNYLLDSNGNITSYISDLQYATLSGKDTKLEFSYNNLCKGSIILDKTFSTAPVTDANKNTIRILDNLIVGSDLPSAQTARPLTGNIHANGAIVAGEYVSGTSPYDTITVPDVVNGKNNRKLQSGDIYANQVWSAVYNDYSEIFDFSDDVIGKEIVGLVVAQDSKNLTKFTVADRKHNNNIIGIVSEQPGICTGGKGCTNGMPVALAGRVKVKYEGKIKPGDFIGLSKKTPGYVTKCKHTSKYRCGKVLRKIDDSFIEVLVLL